MTTQQVANKLVSYCKKGNWHQAQTELYADNAVSIEMPGSPGFPERVEGINALIEKGKQWESMLENFHGIEVDGPIVAGDHFTCTMKMDLTMKGRPRNTNEEIGIFKVENGKIVSEQFFYTV